jgi:uncharacterized repeat protein (TIGR01451 family)
MKKFNTLLLLGLLCPLFSTSQSKLAIALDYITQNKEALQLQSSDYENLRVTDEYLSEKSQITHIYLRQQLYNLDLIGSSFNIHLDRNDGVVYYNNNFIRNPLKHLESNIVSISAPEAIKTVAERMGYESIIDPVLLKQPIGNNKYATYSLPGISIEEIPVQLVFIKLENGRIRLAWDIILSDTQNTINAKLDANNGLILKFESWTISCIWDVGHHKQTKRNYKEAIGHAPVSFLNTGDYNIFPIPVESPNHGSREMIADPSDPIASPFGWHDNNGISGAEFTNTKGNNVHAQLDDDANNGTIGFSPDGGPEINFDYSINYNESPSNYDSASITNLFYWNNVIHDILYQYGFDEVAGNFQDNNYNSGGEENDYVMADAQDASSMNNASFTTPPDGSKPRMQMFLWDTSNPELDGDIDNGIILHEYGHGVSNRLTSGPSNVSCLANREQMGEGWSDWFALMLSMEEGDSDHDIRGLGTYALNESTDGNGIRTYPYSKDMLINPHTYDDIKTEAVPHGVGSVWSAMLWDMSWNLIDEYGFDPDFYNGNGGNNKALALVIEALKYQPCSPGFIDGRNAILAADRVLFNGANQCLIWDAFARRGLGFSANQGDADDRGDGTEAFDLPPDCSISLAVLGNNSVSPGSNIVYTISATNISGESIQDFELSNYLPDSTSFISASNGGEENNRLISWPLIDLGIGQNITRNFTVSLNPEVSEIIDLEDNIENGNSYWTRYATSPGLSNWLISNSNPNNGLQSWFANDVNNHNDQYLTLNQSYYLNSTSELLFWHFYDTEYKWDGGKVEISTDMGHHWSDLGDLMTQNGYNSYIDNTSESPAFSGNSSNYIETKIDLSSFAGQEAMIRFWMHTDGSVGDNGWYIDDIKFLDVGQTIADTVRAQFEGVGM